MAKSGVRNAAERAARGEACTRVETVENAAESWMLPGTTKDHAGITKDWQLVGQTLIAGVQVKEIKSVPTGYGHLTEIWRRDWALDPHPADQAFLSVLEADGISAWHAHARTTDRLFVSHGQMTIVLYDPRPDSPTRGGVNEFRLGAIRPALVVVPPRVFHGVHNTASTPSSLINVVDRAYDYVDPDHYRLAVDTPHIPYRFCSNHRFCSNRVTALDGAGTAR